MARRLGVSREDVVDAAVRVSDRDGLAGLTVAGVAGEVGCRPPSVYHHVDGLDGLLRAVTHVAAADLGDELERARQDAAGVDALESMIEATHSWAVAHPARFDVLRRAVSATAEPELAAARTAVLLPVQDVLVEAGVPERDRAPLLAALVATVRGCIAADLDAGEDDAPALAEARAAGRALLVRLLLDHIRHGIDRDEGAGATGPDRTTVAP